MGSGGADSVPGDLVFRVTGYMEPCREAEIISGYSLPCISSDDFLWVDDRKHAGEFRGARRHGICACPFAQRCDVGRILRLVEWDYGRAGTNAATRLSRAGCGYESAPGGRVTAQAMTRLCITINECESLRASFGEIRA